MKTTIKKNLCIITAAIALAFVTTSCSKSYNCHCIYKTNGSVTHEDDHSINEGKKEKTAASCNQGDNSYTTTLNGNTSVSTTECELTD
jgi:hypothetical protein